MTNFLRRKTNLLNKNKLTGKKHLINFSRHHIDQNSFFPKKFLSTIDVMFRTKKFEEKQTVYFQRLNSFENIKFPLV